MGLSSSQETTSSSSSSSEPSPNTPQPLGEAEDVQQTRLTEQEWLSFCPASLRRLVGTERISVDDHKFWHHDIMNLEDQLASLEPQVLAGVIMSCCSRLDNLRSLLSVSTFELLELLQLLRDMNQDRNSASIDASSGRSRAATIPDMSLLYTEQLPEDRIDLLLRLLFLCRIFIQYILAVCPPPHQAHHFDTLNSPLAIPTSDGASASVSSSSSALNAAAFDASGRPPVGSTVDLEGGDASTLPVSTSAAMPRNRSWFAWWSGNPVEDSSAAHPEMESRVNVPSVSPPPEEEGLDASFSPPQILPPPSIPPDHDPGVQDQLLHSLQSLFTSGNLLSRFVSSLVQACVQIPLTPSGIDLKVELLNVILVLLSSQMYAPPEDATNGLRFFRLIPSDLTPQLVQVMLQQYIAVNDHLPEHHDPASQNSASTSSSSSGPLSPSAAGSARLPHQVKHTLTRAAKGAFALILWPLKLPVRLFRLLFGTDEISHHALSRRSLMLLVILANQSEFPEFRAALGEITDSDLASLILSSSTDLDGAGSPGMSPSSAAPGHSVSFSALYNLFCSNLECEDGDFLLLYAFLMSNSSFKEFVLARTDIDALVVPLLQHLYREAVAGGARLRSRTEGHSSWAVEDPDMDEEEEENQEETRRRYVYVLLIILLVLTQDVAFCESVHSHVYVSGAHLAGWLTEERSPAAASLFSGSPLIPQFLSAAAALSGDRTARGGGAGVEGDTGSSRLRHRRPSVVLHAAKGLGNQLIMPLSALAGFVMGRGSGDSGQSSRHLVDRSGCSLGSLTFIVILRLLVLNLTQDPYIHGTCVGVLSNLARHASGLHPYACHRLVKLLELLARRFLPVALTPAVANVPGESKSDASGGGMGTAARAMDAAKEADSIIVSALRIVTDCLSARLIASNTFLVYELLYSRNSAIEPFRGHRRYWGNVEHLCAVIYHIHTCVKDVIEDPKNSASRVLAAIHDAACLWRVDVLVEDLQFNSSAATSLTGGQDENMVFRYQESPDSTEFFLPYIWSVIYSTQIVPFFPAEMQESLVAVEEASLLSANDPEELLGLPEIFAAPPTAQTSLLPDPTL